MDQGIAKRFFIAAALLAVLALLVYGIAKLAGNPSTGPNRAGAIITDISASDWIFGNKDAKVTLIEYSDFQCPACGRAYPIVKAVSGEFKNQMRFVYRHFPLKQIHINAEKSAYTAEAAGLQGKFWEMSDLLFTNQSKWETSANSAAMFEQYAKDLGLNLDAFKRDFAAKETRDKITKDYDNAIRAGLNHTPTFFLNGKEISPATLEEFRTLIRGAISGN